jgi:dipeptidyl aminopeptidase/acylaminoacyl peptidase
MGQNASTTSYGNVFANAPVTVVEEGQETVLLTQPTQKQLNQLNQLLATNPELANDRHAFRKVFEAKATGVDKAQKKAAKALNRQEVKFEDAGTGEAYALDLLSYTGEKGKNVIAEPGSATPKLAKNPKDASQLLFEKNYGLYILDTKTNKVKALGDHQARMKAHEQKAMLGGTAHGDHEDQRSLYWSTLPVWSQDGSQIAFISNRDHVNTNKPGIMTLWVHDVATGQETMVSGNDLAAARPFGWSADGSVLYNEYQWINNKSDATIVALNPTTKQKKSLAKGDFVAISDDAQTVLYTTGEADNVKLFSLNVATGESKMIYKAANGEVLRSYKADFSADGTRIVTDVQSATGSQSLFVYNLQSGAEQRLTLAQGKQLSGDVVFAGEQLVVPVENLKDQTSETVLMSVE